MKLITPLLLVFLFVNSFGQVKSYETIKIANWTLEKFPKHFLITANKIYTEKDRFSGKLFYYQELNVYGQPEGLTVTLQNDYTSPATAYYYRKGQMVYAVEFFSNSSKALSIENKNLNGDDDGPQLTRKLMSDGKVIEDISVYKDAKLIMLKSFYTPLQPKIEYNFNGVYKKYDENKNLIESGAFVNGMCNGDFIYVYGKSEDKKSIAKYNHGKIVSYTFKDDNGQILQDGISINDSTLKVNYYENGILVHQRTSVLSLTQKKDLSIAFNPLFEMDWNTFLNITIKNYDPVEDWLYRNQKLYYSIVLKYPTPCTYYYPSGKIYNVSSIIDQQSNITTYKVVQYYENGNKMIEGFNITDPRDSTNTIFDKKRMYYSPTGEVERTVEYNKGTKIGLWKEFLDSTNTYTNFKEGASYYRTVTYDNNGKIKDQTINCYYITGELYETISEPKQPGFESCPFNEYEIDFTGRKDVFVYYKDGKIKAKGQYAFKFNNKEGEWIYYNEDGSESDRK